MDKISRRVCGARDGACAGYASLGDSSMWIRFARLLGIGGLLLALTGCAPSLLITPVNDTASLEETQVQPGKGLFPKKIAIIEVEGMLLNARAGGFLQPQENKVSLFTQ